MSPPGSRKSCLLRVVPVKTFTARSNRHHVVARSDFARRPGAAQDAGNKQIDYMDLRYGIALRST
jgi:hypothetical protein